MERSVEEGEGGEGDDEEEDEEEEGEKEEEGAKEMERSVEEGEGEDLNQGQGFENRAAHPHPKFWGAPPLRARNARKFHEKKIHRVTGP